MARCWCATGGRWHEACRTSPGGRRAVGAGGGQGARREHGADGAAPSRSMLITDLLADRAARRGAHPFILHDGRRVTYADFDCLSNRAAHALYGLGVRRGDRVTLALGN